MSSSELTRKQGYCQKLLIRVWSNKTSQTQQWWDLSIDKVAVPP